MTEKSVYRDWEPIETDAEAVSSLGRTRHVLDALPRLIKLSAQTNHLVEQLKAPPIREISVQTTEFATNTTGTATPDKSLTGFEKRYEERIEDALGDSRTRNLYRQITKLATEQDDEWIPLSSIKHESDLDGENLETSLRELRRADLVEQTFTERPDTDDRSFYRVCDVLPKFEHLVEQQ